MENCLVTKLKGSVQNDSLRRLGELFFNVNLAGTETKVPLGIVAFLNVNKEVKIRVIGDGFITNSKQDEPTEKEITVNPATLWNNYTALYVKGTGTITVGIGDKYDIKELSLYNNTTGSLYNYILLDLSELQYLQNIEEIIALCSGDLNELMPIQQKLRIFNCADSDGLTGTLDTFINGFPALTQLKMGYTSRVVKKRSTITSLQDRGITVTVIPGEVIEDE